MEIEFISCPQIAKWVAIGCGMVSGNTAEVYMYTACYSNALCTLDDPVLVSVSFTTVGRGGN